MDEKSKLRVRRERGIESQLKSLAPVIRSWYLSTAIKYMKVKVLKNTEEDFFERISDFYLAELDRIEGKYD